MEALVRSAMPKGRIT